uniref:Uncharacterized protein n=1 Tax=Candidatus Kentrum sp. TC TaxID=2126339 RepID=A0A450Z4B9_9GAMM|nr:MAG: hypothetical protein BECKTC1821E_GA0114239_11235 [Candidatus Kentron sp. TC]
MLCRTFQETGTVPGGHGRPRYERWRRSVCVHGHRPRVVVSRHPQRDRRLAGGRANSDPPATLECIGRGLSGRCRGSRGPDRAVPRPPDTPAQGPRLVSRGSPYPRRTDLSVSRRIAGGPNPTPDDRRRRTQLGVPWTGWFEGETSPALYPHGPGGRERCPRGNGDLRGF